MTDVIRPRLCLITPRQADDDGLAGLQAALSAGDVACLLIMQEAAADRRQFAAESCRIAQGSGAASLIHNDIALCGEVDADGVHIDTGIADVKRALDILRPNRIVGAGGIDDRHGAMTIGETDPDYLFFGRPDADARTAPHRKTLKLAAWWAPLFEIPAVALAGSDLSGIADLVATGADFIALRDAVWTHPDGPAAAIAEADRLIDAVLEAA